MKDLDKKWTHGKTKDITSMILYDFLTKPGLTNKIFYGNYSNQFLKSLTRSLLTIISLCLYEFSLIFSRLFV